MKRHKPWLFHELVEFTTIGKTFRQGLIIMLLGVIILSLKILFADTDDHFIVYTNAEL